MKEEQNETSNRWEPTEAEMNDMYKNAWLDFHADEQKAKKEVNRRYAKMVDTFGSYKNMPEGIKEILKQDYAAHEAKWRDNGEEMQKRFGGSENEPAPLPELTQEQYDKKQEFLQQLQQQRQNRQRAYEPER